MDITLSKSLILENIHIGDSECPEMIQCEAATFDFIEEIFNDIDSNTGRSICKITTDYFRLNSFATADKKSRSTPASTVYAVISGSLK